VRACSYYHLQNLIVKQLLNILPADAAAAAAATAAAAGTKKNLKPANLIRCSSAPATVAPRATAAKHNGAGGAGSGGAGGGGGGSKKLVPPPDVTFQEMLAKPGAIEMLKGHIGKENAYLAPFCTEKGSIYQDRLGTDIGKATQKRGARFCRGPARGGHPLCNPAADGARLQRAAAGSRRWPGWCARKRFRLFCAIVY
jgi:hypothetical protein